jgi:hypothetical protein
VEYSVIVMGRSEEFAGLMRWFSISLGSLRRRRNDFS